MINVDGFPSRQDSAISDRKILHSNICAADPSRKDKLKTSQDKFPPYGIRDLPIAGACKMKYNSFLWAFLKARQVLAMQSSGNGLNKQCFHPYHLTGIHSRPRTYSLQ
ncbi:MAG: hypothetical protein ACXV7J_13365 [Methylomonas sp.]